MAVDIGTAQGYLDLDISKFTSALQQANAAASTQMNSMSSNFQSGFQGVGSVMTSAGKTLTTAVTAPVIAMGTAAVKTTANFDKSMSKVQALSGATGKDFETLRQKAQDMGATTRYSASEAADALGYMALAGWDTNQMVSGLDGVLNLAAASDMDLAQASDMVTDYLSAFGLEAKDAGKMADQMAYAQAHSNTSTQQLGDAFGNCAATMASGGQTMETTTALLEAMANQGTKGSEAGTQLSAIMRDLTHKMEDGAIQIGDTTVAVQDQNGNFRSLIDIMADVEDATDGMGTAERAAALSSVFTAHSIKGVNQILNEGVDTIAGYEDALHNCDGTAKEMADTLLNNLSGQLTILKSALEGLAIQIGDILMPYIQKFVGWVQQLVEKFSNLSKEEKEHIIKIAAIAAAIGPLLLVGGKLLTGLATMIKTFNTLKTSFAALKTGFKGLSAAIGGISAPVVAVIAVIAALVAMFVHLWKTNEDFRNKITGIWEGIKAKFEEFGQGITDRLNALGFDFDNFTQVVGAVWNEFCNLLAPVFEGAFEVISQVLGTALDVLTGLFDVFSGIFTGNWELAWTGVKEIFEGLWNGISGIFETVLNTIKGVADVFLGWFGTSWEEVWTNISNFFKNIWEGIKTFFQNAVTTIQNVATTAFTAISSFFTTILNGIKTVFTTIWNAINTVVTNVVNVIKNTISTVFTAIKGTIQTIMEAVKTTITNIWNAIKTTVTNVVEAVKTTVSNAFTNMKSSVTNTINALKSSIESVFNGIKTAMSNAIETAKSNVINAMTNAKNGMVNVFNGIGDTFRNIGKNVIQGIINGIGDMVSSLYESIKSALSGLVDKAKGALGISSPSKVFRKEIGKWLPPGIADGFMAAMPAAEKQMQKGLDDMVDDLSDNQVELGIADNMMASFRVVAEYFESIEQRLANAVQGMRDELVALVQAGQMVVGADGSLSYVGYGGFRNSALSVNNSTGNSNGQTRSGGDTFIFNSPKAIDEIEAARQMEKTKRDMAEGF